MVLSRWYLEPGRLFAAVFFGLFVTGVCLLVGWFVLTAPYKVERHMVEGNTYICDYYKDKIECHLENDPEIGFGKIEQ